jgi:Succinylglutamate desuccinylase / Aspartoacylase family
VWKPNTGRDLALKRRFIVSRSPPDDGRRRARERSSVPELRSFAREVAARVERLSGITTTAIGSVAYGGHSYPIPACIARGHGVRDRPWILISAGAHGDEVAGVFAALKFLETRTDTVAPWFQIAVLPCINPSGFELDTLETAAGANLNRLFGRGSKEPEIGAVESWLNHLQHRFVATLDLHEVSPIYRGEGFVESDNPRGCYLYETQTDRARRIGKALIDALPPSFEVCQWPLIYQDRNDNGVISYPEACMNPIYAQGTTFDAYLSSRFTSHSFTLETPMGWPLEKRVQTHLIWLDAAISLLRQASKR